MVQQQTASNGAAVLAIGKGSWLVASKSQPGGWRRVDDYGAFGIGSLTCDCPAGASGRGCRHAAAVAEVTRRERQRAALAAVAALFDETPGAISEAHRPAA